MPADPSPARLTPLQWVICATAAIGFLFDSYVILMLPLVVRPALIELTPQTYVRGPFVALPCPPGQRMPRMSWGSTGRKMIS